MKYILLLPVVTAFIIWGIILTKPQDVPSCYTYIQSEQGHASLELLENGKTIQLCRIKNNRNYSIQVKILSCYDWHGDSLIAFEIIPPNQISKELDLTDAHKCEIHDAFSMIDFVILKKQEKKSLDAGKRSINFSCK